MGRDKALEPFLEEPLVQRVLSRVRHLAGELIVVTNRPEDYAFLNLPLVPDVLPGRGALGGLYTALHAASQPLVAVIACDMPFASPDLLALQQEFLLEKQVDAVIPRTEGGLEPFHSIYRRSSCLPLVEQVLNDGKWRVDSWLSRAQVHFLTYQEVSARLAVSLEEYQQAFWNLNTPEEFKAAEELAASRG
jgi:molybdopterin-guanine dinucleotide biosynthesis protein A